LRRIRPIGGVQNANVQFSPQSQKPRGTHHIIEMIEEKAQAHLNGTA
jgi:hypothetical protein